MTWLQVIIFYLFIYYISQCGNYKNEYDKKTDELKEKEVIKEYIPQTFKDLLNHTRNKLDRQIQNLTRCIQTSLYSMCPVRNSDVYDSIHNSSYYKLHPFNGSVYLHFDLKQYSISISPPILDQYTIFIIVPVAPTFLISREAIRRSYGKELKLESHTIKTIFLTGTPELNGNMTYPLSYLQVEAGQYHDLFVIDQEYSYKYHTIFILKMYEWIIMNYPKVEYIIKVNPYVFINTHKLVPLLYELKSDMIGYKAYTFGMLYPFHGMYIVSKNFMNNIYNGSFVYDDIDPRDGIYIRRMIRYFNILNVSWLDSKYVVELGYLNQNRLLRKNAKINTIFSLPAAMIVYLWNYHTNK